MLIHGSNLTYPCFVLQLTNCNERNGKKRATQLVIEKTYLCGLHFKAVEIYESTLKRRWLSLNAVPSLKLLLRKQVRNTHLLMNRNFTFLLDKRLRENSNKWSEAIHNIVFVVKNLCCGIGLNFSYHACFNTALANVVVQTEWVSLLCYYFRTRVLMLYLFPLRLLNYYISS